MLREREYLTQDCHKVRQFCSENYKDIWGQCNILQNEKFASS